jgi:nucleoside-diphosphate-sugar epimerase
MKIFVAGATGTLGRPVVRMLLSRGHEVVGLSRSESGVRRIDGMGAQGVVGNALDGDRMRTLVQDARPEQIVHLLTALPPGGVMRKRQLRPTNTLRIDGTANLIHAAAAAGVRRIVAESFIGVYGPGQFTEKISEDNPLPPAGEGAFREAVLAMRSLEDQLRLARAKSVETVALRIGLLYGLEVPSTRSLIQQARSGRLFVPRGLSGVGAFVHNDDAAAAIIAAIEQPDPAPVYNIVDDEPTRMVSFLSQLAAAVSAPPPRQIPSWIVKLSAPVIAELGSATLLLSNAKAKRELGWTLRYPTLHEGLADLRRTATMAA